MLSRLHADVVDPAPHRLQASPRMIGVVVAICMVLCNASMRVTAGQEPAASPEHAPQADGGPRTVLPGHSQYGDFLNEGPRQKAYLMGGTGHVRFPATTSNGLAQKFIEQGIGQLHGFWYLEAERSFRQAATLDPDCAIAYWGASLASAGDRKRSLGFRDEAIKRKEKASPRERMYIEAWDAYLKAPEDKPKERAEAYTQALEEIALKFPDDIEAKAFLALQLYNNRSAEIPITSYLAVDALMQQIFAVEPFHPAHHFRIHLWDGQKPEVALTSAAVCGQGSPAIAHMWHMPGHIYSRVKRYHDAVWQQEASARVDHSHMMRDRLLPDQIHNFAHNNEWLIRNMHYIGRVHDAVDLAKNMIELPRHPKYNTLEKQGSNRYGRERLLETLNRFEMWDELVAMCESPYLKPTEEFSSQVEHLRNLGRAYGRSGRLDKLTTILADLNRQLTTERGAREKVETEAIAKAQEQAVDNQLVAKAQADAEAQTAATGASEEQRAKVRAEAAEKSRVEQLEQAKPKIEQAKADAGRPHETKIQELEKTTSELEAYQAIARGEYAVALPLLRKATGVDATFLTTVQYLAGETEAAIEAAKSNVSSHENEVQPLAGLIQLHWRANQKEEARQVFERLREMSSAIDIDVPVFAQLAPIAQALGLPSDWRVAARPRDDVGVRPELDKLGPFRWEPSSAPDWELKDAQGNTHTLKQFHGQPVVILFYLGYGCLHCAQQLQAFAPLVKEFDDVGIRILAISTDDAEGLKNSIDNYKEGLLPIPLVANPERDVFKAYRAYDDFEDRPMHGTFLVDERGLIRWQDIGHEPFMEPKFVLEESLRLLNRSRPPVVAELPPEPRRPEVTSGPGRLAPAVEVPVGSTAAPSPPAAEFPPEPRR